MTTPSTGRPRKCSTPDMIAIIDRYFIELSDSSTALFTHGIYRRLSDYAKSLGYNLEPHDFSRNTAAVEHLKTLDTNRVRSDSTSLLVPDFEPLDIPTLMNCSKKRIEESIRNREQHFEKLHQKAAHAIEHHLLLSKKADHLTKELQAATANIDTLVAEKAALKKQLHAAKTDVAYLSKIIRRDVEEERAHQIFQSLNSRETAMGIVGNTINHSLHELTREDRKLYAEAQQQAHSLELNSLFDGK